MQDQNQNPQQNPHETAAQPLTEGAAAPAPNPYADMSSSDLQLLARHSEIPSVARGARAELARRGFSKI